MLGKSNQKKAFQKPVEEPVIESRKFHYILLQEKIEMEYGMAEELPSWKESTAQELLGEGAEKIHYKFGRMMRVVAHSGSGTRRYNSFGISLSSEGMIVKVQSEDVVEELGACGRLQLQMKLYPGDMPEDFSMNLKVGAVLVNAIYTRNGEILCAFRFKEPLSYYDNQKRSNYMTATAALFFAAALLCLLLLYSESIWCLRYDGLLYRYSIVVFIFACGRYLFSALYKPMRMSENYYPMVTVIIPNMSDGKNIQRTVASCRNQRYPKNKIEIQIMHGCKTKGEAMLRGAKHAKGDLLVFVGDGSELHMDAVRQLVQPFQDPYMGAVTGSPRVRNRYYNIFTRILAMENFHRFRVGKAREAFFDAVAGISGELCCYRKEILLTREPVKKYRTGYQDSALVFINVASSKGSFLKKQKAYFQANIRDSKSGWAYILKKEPFVFLFCYLNKILYVLFPFVLIYGLIFVPVLYDVIPVFYMILLLILAALVLFLQIWLIGFQIRKPREERRKSK